jgi:ribosome maturation factor RimP
MFFVNTWGVSGLGTAHFCFFRTKDTKRLSSFANYIETNPSLQKVAELTTQVVEREGCLLYDLEFSGRILRIYIDKQDGSAGIDECTRVARGLNELFDEADPVEGGAYSLEVSTPGLERSLKLPWHFEKVVGKKIWMKTTKTLELLGVQGKKWKNAKTFSEVLNSVTTEGLKVQLDNEELLIPFEAIEKSKLVFEMEDKSTKKSSNKKIVKLS